MMINDARLDAVIADLRMELDRIDRAIAVFEKLALKKGVCRNRTPRTSATRLRPTPPPAPRRPPIPPS